MKLYWGLQLLDCSRLNYARLSYLLGDQKLRGSSYQENGQALEALDIFDNSS
jgi:hypothetical protein